MATNEKLRLMEEEMNRFEAELASQMLSAISTAIPSNTLNSTQMYSNANMFIPHQLTAGYVTAPPLMPPGVAMYASFMQPMMTSYPVQAQPVTTTPSVSMVQPAATVTSSDAVTPKVIMAPPQMAGPVELAARVKETAKWKIITPVEDDDDDVTRALLTAAAGVTYKRGHEPGGKKPPVATITNPPLDPVTTVASATTPSSSATAKNTATRVPDPVPKAASTTVPPPMPPPPYRGGSNATPATGNDSTKKKKYIRIAAGVTWVDPTLSEWDPNDFRMFCGDLGNEVNDDTLARAFNHYPSFQKARVVRDKRSGKSRGYGFVSFSDPDDFTKAMREMNGKYVGNRPIKLKRSDWRSRQLETHRKKEKERKKLGLKN